MKYVKYALIFLGIFVSGQALGQEIYEPEGVNMPGQWNEWTNSNDPGVMGNFRMEKRSFGGGQYITTLHFAASGGDTTADTYDWLFTSGPDDNLYANKWADASPINIDDLTDVTHMGGTDNSITVENGFYYTFILDDNGYNNSQAAVFKTSADPVHITSVSGVPTEEVTENTPVTITVELDKAHSPEEIVYIRYSTDEFQTSDAIEITNFSGGTTGSADIPGQPMNANVDFYVLTTTIDEADWDGKTDLATISFDNNGGSNYSYFYEANVSPLNGAEDISTTPELSWYTVDNLAGYDLQVSKNNDFSSPVIDESGIDALSFSITDPLDINTTYYWRFKGDTASVWTDTLSFKTETAITFANVQFPESAVLDEGGSATIYGQLFVPDITALEGASDDISAWIGINPTNENPENWDEQSWTDATYNANPDPSPGNNDEYLAEVGSSLSPGTYYYAYRYQYKNQSYAYGVIDGFWADTNQTLGTLVIKDIPELESPEDEATNTSLEPLLSWTATDENINGFNLQVSESSTFESMVIEEQDLSSTPAEYQISAGQLQHETTYYWRVQAQYDTTASSWSPAFSFTTQQGAPGEIALTAPANESEDVSLLPEFEWEVDSGAENYELVVSTDQSFADDSQTAFEKTGLTSGSYTSTETDSLEKETTYYWRVRGVNSAGNGAWSEVFSFTTIGDPPTQIVLSNPQDEAEGVSTRTEFEWQANEDAASYDLQVSTASDFSQTETRVIDQSEISGNTFTLNSTNELEVATVYYWRVRGVNSAGEGAWSSGFTFTTEVPQTALVAPEDEDTSTPLNPVLSWRNVENSQHYDLQIATDTAFEEIVTDSASISDTSYVANALEYGTTYYWRVRVQANDLNSEWTSPFSFTVRASAPQLPELISPDSGAVDVSLSPTLVWEAPANADTYEVQVATSNSFDDGVVFDTTGYDETNVDLSELENGTEYFWRVRAVNNEGTTGDWSEVGAFTTLPLLPDVVVLSSPADSSEHVSIPLTFSWESSDRVSQYEFQFSEEADFTFYSDTTLSETEIELQDFASGTGYFWRVRASNSGGSSAWSEVRYVKVGVGGFPGPELTTPEDQAEGLDTEVAFSWSAVTGSESYHFQLSGEEDFSALITDSSGVENTTFTLSDLERESVYYWRVRGADAGSATAWSSVFSFQTKSEAPAMVSLVAPADSTLDEELPVSFHWTPADGADHYELQLSQQADFSVSLDSTNLADTTLTLTSLERDSEYYWRVRAVNESGAGAWSSNFYFTTTIQLPGEPELINPENEEEVRSTVRFGWNEAPRADTYQIQLAEEDSFENPTVDSAGIESLTLEITDLKEAATYYWRVRATNRAGAGGWSDTLSFTTETLTSLEDDFVPKEFALHQNYPNPFNPTTNIQYDMKEAGEVRIQIYDISGRLIQTLVSDRKTAGRYRATFDASSLASGIYLMRMEAGSFLQIKKMTLIK